MFKQAVTYPNTRPNTPSRHKADRVRWLPAGLALCFAVAATANPNSAQQAQDESPGSPAPLPALSIEGFKAKTLKPEADRAIDEIIVFGIRKPRVNNPEPAILEDPLRARVMKEIRELQLLDGEFEWRNESADLDAEPPRLRFGYDPRSDLRLTETSPQVRLPFEWQQPATLFSVDF